MTDNPEEQQVSLILQPRWMSLESYSLLLLLYSAITYSIMACLIKLGTQAGIPSTELVFFRALIQGLLVIIAMFLCSDGEGILIRKPFGGMEVRWVVAARGLIGGIGFLLYSYAMSVLPIGDAMTLIAMSPIITVISASFALHEPAHLIHVLAALASFSASILISRPPFLMMFLAGHVEEDTVDPVEPKYDMSGYFAALCRACCGAAVHVLIRRAGKVGVHTLNLLFSWALFATFFSWLLLVLPEHTMFGTTPTFIWPASSAQWMYVWGVVFLGSIGNLLFNYAARNSPAGKNSIVRSSGILWSYLLEIAVFHQLPDLWTTAGVVLVVCSLLAISLHKIKDQKQMEAAEGTVSETAHLVPDQSSFQTK